MNTTYPFIVVYMNEPRTNNMHYEMLVRFSEGRDLYVSLPIGSNISHLANKVDEYLNFLDKKFGKNPSDRLEMVQHDISLVDRKGDISLEALTENDSKMLFGFLDRSDKKSA